MSFAGSLDVEVLIRAGCVRSVSAAYVGLGRHGFAPHFTNAVKEATIDDREYSEWLMLGGLRAAAMGIPFLPTRAAAGSGLLDHLTIEPIVDPYGGAEYLAVPPLRPDVTVLHAWQASDDGNVQFAWPPEHLWDIDVMAARASSLVIVTVEQVVDAAEIAEQPQLTRLFSFEVDAVVELPGGSWPTSSPPLHSEDSVAIQEYVDSNGSIDLLASNR